MVFKRRNRRSVLRAIAEVFWPRGGWGRAFSYIKHRLRRLPDPPHKISRGIMAGVIASFTPFFGLHFLTAGIIAWVMRGNFLASLLATFVGNPITFPLIAALNLRIGYWLVGDGTAPGVPPHGLGNSFAGAMGDLWHNVRAVFTPARAEWSRLEIFFDEVFLPYLVGGIIPGIVAGVIAYYIALPILVAYQNRRKGRLKERLAKLRHKTTPRADGNGGPS